MKNLVRKIILTITALILLTSSVIAKADVKSGIYSIPNSVYHESELGMSMSRSYLDETMQARITKDGVVFIIGFSGTQYMKNYRIKINGAEALVDIIEENKDAGTIKLQASAPSTDVKISAAIYVDPMGRDVEFDVIPDYTQMTLIEAIEEAPVVEPAAENLSEETTEETVAVEDEITEESKSKDYIKIAVPAVVVVIAGVLVLAFKRKK